jgi:hypothetical protein
MFDAERAVSGISSAYNSLAEEECETAELRKQAGWIIYTEPQVIAEGRSSFNDTLSELEGR